MKNQIPNKVLDVYEQLEKAGFQAFFVGGCVRDILMNRTTHDWDLTTDATPEDIQKIFSNSFYDNRFGTVGVIINEEIYDLEKKYVEVTTFRTESQYENARHPEQVSWGKSIEEDLSRRDFTMNAIALRFTKKALQEEFIDPYGGKTDIENGIVRTVGNPDARFSEDALRVLRAIRFATTLDFKIEDKTWEGIINNNSGIEKISGERIRDELLKILVSDQAYNGIVLLDLAGILDIIFPELAKGKGVSQVRPGRHHKTDVFTHNIESLKHAPTKNPLVKLAALLHDVGKPYVARPDAEGHVTFYNHEVKGAQVIENIAERLKLSKKDKEKIITLIRWHMFTVDEFLTDAAIRRFIRRIGLENVTDMMDLRIGDRLGGGTQVAESWRLKKFKERIAEQLNPPFAISDLAIDGNDIMQELKITPGRKIGQILQKLFEEVDEDMNLNTREYLIKRVHEIESEN